MAQRLKHISTLFLLIFIFMIGGRSVVAARGCHCFDDTTKELHHSCCGCDEHLRDCSFHTQSLDQNCTSHSIGVEQIEALWVESKLSLSKRIITTTYITQVIIVERVECNESIDFNVHDKTLRLIDWICDVGLLRAPPVC